VEFRVDRLTDDQMQAALGTEFGGMNEVLANLYGATGNAEHLRIARQFEHKAIVDPLLRHDDPLNGLHATTQSPKIIGAAREYELTGEPRYRDIATFFWDRVVHHRRTSTRRRNGRRVARRRQRLRRGAATSSAARSIASSSTTAPANRRTR
jgi:DUF1680 family protein